MSDQLLHILARFRAHGIEPTDAGDSTWRARCPVHRGRHTVTLDVDELGVWVLVDGCPCLPHEIARAIDVQVERAGWHSYVKPGERIEVIERAEKARAEYAAAVVSGRASPLGADVDTIAENLRDRLAVDWAHPKRLNRYRCPSCGDERHGGVKLDVHGGTVLLTCFGEKCGAPAILTPLGLTVRDLYPPLAALPNVTWYDAPVPAPSTVAPAVASVGGQTGAGVGEAAFWSARPWLAAVLVRARERRIFPWSVLGAALAVASSRIGPHVVLPAIVGAPAPLSLYVALVGDSGDGKSASLAVARELLADPCDLFPPAGTGVQVHEVATGQGITAAYVERFGKGRPAEQYADSALWTIDEIDSLRAYAGMNGANILATLKTGYSGGEIGGMHADPSRRRPVPAMRYRLALVAGVQPAKAGVLLDDADGGTPQRFVWMPCDDAACDDPATAPSWQGWVLPDRLAAYGTVSEPPVSYRERVVLDVCEAAQAEIVAASPRERRRRGVAAGLDGHALQTRLRVAAILALIEGRTDVDDADWALAGQVMAVSAATRERCTDAATETRRAVNRARGHADAERAEAATDREFQSATRAVLKWLRSQSGRRTRGYVSQGVTKTYRPHVTSALAYLVDGGLVRQFDDGYEAVS